MVSRIVYQSCRAQLGVFFIRPDEEIGARSPHGYISLADGVHEKIENASKLRE
jgi:hypothetical protein